MGIPQNKSIAEPNLRDVLNLHTKEVMLALNCHAVGTIQSFDSSLQTAIISINYQKTVFNQNEDAILMPYPLLLDCPIIVLGGGNASLTFPISQGDECLVLFNDRDIDNWFSGSSTSGPATNRLHSISDAVAIVGLHSLNHSIEGYDMTRAVLQNGSTLVGVGAALVKIANAETSLGVILQNLMTALTAFNTALSSAATAFEGNPVIETAAFAGGTAMTTAILAFQTQVTSIQTLVTELLE